MENGDFVYVDYVGRIKDTNEIFDLTKEDVARKEGIYDEKIRYEPIPVIVGAGLLLRGLEEEIKKMKVGERKVVEIPPEKAFGERNENLVKLVPYSIFKKNNVEPKVGDFVTVNGLRAKVLSVSGGRVKLDFNHPLAGKTLVYEVEVKEKIEDLKEKVKAVFSYFLKFDEEKIELKIVDKKLEVVLKIDMPKSIRKRIAELLIKWTELEKVAFIEEYG